MHLIDASTNPIQISHDIQPPFRRDFLSFLGNQRHLLRQDFLREIRDGLLRGHFEIEFDLDGLLQHSNVSILDVSAIFSQMDRNHIGTPELRQRRRPDGVWFNGPTCLSNGRDVIDVNSECGHIRFTYQL